MSRLIVEDGMVLMACPLVGCESDKDGGFWVELEEDYCDDHFGGHVVWMPPEDAPCPACGTQGVEVETEGGDDERTAW